MTISFIENRNHKRNTQGLAFFKHCRFWKSSSSLLIGLYSSWLIAKSSLQSSWPIKLWLYNLFSELSAIHFENCQSYCVPQIRSIAWCVLLEPYNQYPWVTSLLWKSFLFPPNDSIDWRLSFDQGRRWKFRQKNQIQFYPLSLPPQPQPLYAQIAAEVLPLG